MRGWAYCIHTHLKKQNIRLKMKEKTTEKLEIKDERIAPKEVRHIFTRFHGMRVPKEQTNTETKWWP